MISSSLFSSLKLYKSLITLCSVGCLEFPGRTNEWTFVPMSHVFHLFFQTKSKPRHSTYYATLSKHAKFDKNLSQTQYGTPNSPIFTKKKNKAQAFTERLQLWTQSGSEGLWSYRPGARGERACVNEVVVDIVRRSSALLLLLTAL